MSKHLTADGIRALKVVCAYCKAQPGEPCVNKVSGQTLENFAAHLGRLQNLDDDEPF